MIKYIKLYVIGRFVGKDIPNSTPVLTVYVEIGPQDISTHNLGSRCHFFILKVSI